MYIFFMLQHLVSLLKLGIYIEFHPQETELDYFDLLLAYLRRLLVVFQADAEVEDTTLQQWKELRFSAVATLPDSVTCWYNVAHWLMSSTLPQKRDPNGPHTIRKKVQLV